MEKQTQVREIVTNTSRSVNYMPQPSDGAPRAVTLIPGDRIRPLVTEAVERRSAERELEKLIRYDEVKVVVKKLNVWREANTISNLQTNLVAVASFRPTHRSPRYQTHLPILPLSK